MAGERNAINHNACPAVSSDIDIITLNEHYTISIFVVACYLDFYSHKCVCLCYISVEPKPRVFDWLYVCCPQLTVDQEFRRVFRLYG